MHFSLLFHNLRSLNLQTELLEACDWNNLKLEEQNDEKIKLEDNNDDVLLEIENLNSDIEDFELDSIKLE